jgi:hypothetical protein
MECGGLTPLFFVSLKSSGAAKQRQAAALQIIQIAF